MFKIIGLLLKVLFPKFCHLGGKALISKVKGTSRASEATVFYFQCANVLNSLSLEGILHTGPVSLLLYLKSGNFTVYLGLNSKTVRISHSQEAIILP